MVEEAVVKVIIKELGFDLKIYDNGRWAIGGVIDWWTITGTAIEKKSRKEHRLSFSEPQEIKTVLQSLNPTKQ